MYGLILPYQGGLLTDRGGKRESITTVLYKSYYSNTCQ